MVSLYSVRNMSASQGSVGSHVPENEIPWMLKVKFESSTVGCCFFMFMSYFSFMIDLLSFSPSCDGPRHVGI